MGFSGSAASFLVGAPIAEGESVAKPSARLHEVVIDGRTYLVVLADGLLTEDALSRGEASVARLAARGLCNAAIAARRGTSPRTVANQVARVLAKLGLRSRHALAAKVVFDDMGEVA